MARIRELEHFYKRVPEGLSVTDSLQVSTESDPAVVQAMAERVLPTICAVV